MSQALQYLLEDTQRYMLIINRATINAENGETQDASITLSEDDPPSFDNSLDPRLKRSRQVIIILVQKDGGVAKIDLTARKWDIWVKSATLPKKIRGFNQKLIAGAHTRLLTTSTGLWIATIPIWGTFLLFLGWSVSSSETRHRVWGAKSYVRPVQWPTWILHFESTTFRFEPLWVLVALAIWIVVTVGGGSRVWPRYLSGNSLQRAVYEIRSNFILPQNLNAPLFVGVVSAMLGALVTYLVTR